MKNETTPNEQNSTRARERGRESERTIECEKYVGDGWEGKMDDVWRRLEKQGGGECFEL